MVEQGSNLPLSLPRRGSTGLKSRFCFILLPLLYLAASSAIASAPVGVKEYLGLRKSMATQVSLQELKSNSGSYIGKVLEIRGNLTGFTTSDGSQECNITICNSDTGSYTISTDEPPTQTGTELACLVKIGERSTCSLSDLRMVACTFLVDLQRTEPKPTRATAQPAKTTASPGKTPTKSQPARYISSEEIVVAYTKAVKRFNSKLSNGQADTIARSVLGFSYRYKLDPRLVCAVILAESHFRIGATSPCGAQGLGQLMPSTAAGLGVNDAYDPVQNIYGSVRYVKGMLDRMSGNKPWDDLTWYDLALALAAYNAGPNAVKRHGGIPPYRETQNYVKKVTSIYKQLCGVK